MCVFCQRCSSSISRCPDPKYEKASLEKIHADLKQWSNVRQYIYFLLCVCVFLIIDVIYLMCLTFIICPMSLISDNNCHHVFDLSQIESHHLVTSSPTIIIACHVWYVSFKSCCRLSAVLSPSSHSSRICPPLIAHLCHLFENLLLIRMNEWVN